MIKLYGDITRELCEQLRRQLTECIQAGKVCVVLDLKDCRHIHTPGGLAMLVERAYRLRLYGGDLKLAWASKYMRDLLAVGGVDKVFDLCSDVDQAERTFRRQA